jgi:hypothetical protein
MKNEEGLARRPEGESQFAAAAFVSCQAIPIAAKIVNP